MINVNFLLGYLGLDAETWMKEPEHVYSRFTKKVMTEVLCENVNRLLTYL